MYRLGLFCIQFNFARQCLNLCVVLFFFFLLKHIYGLCGRISNVHEAEGLSSYTNYRIIVVRLLWIIEL